MAQQTEENKKITEISIRKFKFLADEKGLGLDKRFVRIVQE